MKPAEYKHLIQQLLDDEISADEFERLDLELRQNPEALSAYRMYVGIHCGLERKSEIDAAIRATPVVPVERFMALQRRRVARISMLAAAAVILITGLALWFTMATEEIAIQATVQSVPGSSYVISHSTEGDPASKAVMFEGSVLRLDHGAIELALPHQVRAMVEAPATLTLVDDRRIHLDRGRVFFEVKSPEGHGFTVEARGQRIVDLGTVFGVDLPIGSDRAHLHVFEGSVRIEGAERGVGGKVIRAPMAASIQGGQVSELLEISANRFLKTLPERVKVVFEENLESGLQAGTEYAVHMDSTAIRDASGNGFAGILEKNPWRFSTSKELRIRNPGFEDAKVEKGEPVPHWQEVTGANLGFNTYGQIPKPTEGFLQLIVSEGLMLVQNLQVPIRVGATYTLSLDVGNTLPHGPSQAIVRFFGSDTGFESPLKEIEVHLSDVGWLRNQVLSFTATESEAAGQTLGIALCSKVGKVTFDNLRIFETPASGSMNPALALAGGDDATVGMSERAPVATKFHPAPGTTDIRLDEIPTIVFDQPVRFGSGRIVLRDLTQGSETELVVGSKHTSLDGRVLRFLPPLQLADGTSQVGGIPGWESSGPVSRYNPSGNGRYYDHPDLADDSRARGILDGMQGRILASLGGGGVIRRSLAKPEDGRVYTISVGIGCRSQDATDGSLFAGYRIRLLCNSVVLAEVSGNTPPGPPNRVTPVGFSWSPSHQPKEITGDATFSLEISALEPILKNGGSLDINHVRVTSLGASGRK